MSDLLDFPALGLPPAAFPGFVRLPTLSRKQTRVLARLRAQGPQTLAQLTELIGDQYHRPEHYVGMTLSSMVKRGLIYRPKRGTYDLPKGSPYQK